MSKLRMEAYYYSFEPTGVEEIDKILSAVACAGKAYHNTSEWPDDVPYNPSGCEVLGDNPVEWIQNAANAAAEALASRKERLDGLKRLETFYKDGEK